MHQSSFPELSAFHSLLNRTDWAGSPLGEIAGWPSSLRANTGMMLDSLVPMAIAWGPQRVLIYNEAYTRLLGEKHPWALGRPVEQVWAEVWERIKPLVERAYAGEAFHREDIEMPIERGGRCDPAWFTFFYSPLRGDTGAIAGMSSTVIETTSRVQAERAVRRLNLSLEERVEAATTELRRSEAHLQSLFGQTAAGIAETGLDFRVVRANDKFCAIVGRPLDEVVGHPLDALIHPDDLREHTALIERMLASGTPFEVENRYLRPDGTEVWAAKMVAPIVEPGASGPTSILAIVIDITARRRAEISLRANAERLRLATDAASLGIWSWGADDENPTWENDRLYEMIGIARDGAPVDTVRLLTELVHPDDIAPYQAAMARTLATGEPFRYEGRFYRASDRALRWFEFTGALHRDDRGTPRRMVGTVLDVTERKEMDDRLRLREERYRTLLTAMDEGFCVAELVYGADGRVVDHRFLEANPAFERHTGLDDPIGKSARDMAPSIEQHWNTLYAEVAASGAPQRIVQQAAPLGRWFDVFIARADDSSRDKVAVLFRDITEQRRAEEELRTLAADLSKANQRQNEFLATLAHELRNPLAPIRTGLDLMRISPDNKQAMAKVRDMMERQTNHLVHLVNDLLDLARVQSGKVELKKTRVALQDVIRAAVETAVPLIEEKRHRLTLDMPDTPVELDADANRLAQVVGNLLTNAAKYTPGGGSIALSVRSEDGNAVVSVRDNGIGIPPEALPTLFEMFNQGRHGMDYAQGGLGIGLNLVKRLTQKHGGTVGVVSEGPNQGSTFTLRLPLAPDQPPAAPGAVPDTSSRGERGPLRILVADDNQDAADLLAQLLQSQGHQVSTVHDGTAALAAARALPPDLALLDIGMPGMTGYEVARALRQLPNLEGTVLAAVTGWGAQEDRRRSREAGFDHHMTKPIDMDSLKQLLAGINAA